MSFGSRLLRKELTSSEERTQQEPFIRLGLFLNPWLGPTVSVSHMDPRCPKRRRPARPRPETPRVVWARRSARSTKGCSEATRWPRGDPVAVGGTPVHRRLEIKRHGQRIDNAILLCFQDFGCGLTF